MARLPFFKPLVTVGMVAGLLIATVLTATAASEGNPFGRSATAQGAPTQRADADAPVTSDVGPNAPRAWVWPGYVGYEDLEGGHFYLKSERCGAWALLPANDEVAEKLKELQGEHVLIVGHVSTEPNIFQRPTIKVLLAATDRGELPDNVRLFPRCEQHPEPLPLPRPHEPGLPDFIQLLKRLGLQGLHQVPPGERFTHFLGAEVSYLDANNALTVAKLSAGTVIGVGESELTYQPNGPVTSAAGVTVQVDDDTIIIRPGRDLLELIERGDKVLVLQVNGRTAAIVASDEVTVWPETLAPADATSVRPLPPVPAQASVAMTAVLKAGSATGR